MEDNIKKSIIDGMIKKNLVECWEEKITEEIVEHAPKANSDEETENDIAVTSDGIEYSKKMVFAYLKEKGYAMDPMTVELTAKMIYNNNELYNELSKKIEREEKNIIVRHKVKKHHNLENATDEDVLDYIKYKILEEVNTLKSQIMLESFVDYRIEVVNDRMGATDIQTLSNILQRYSDSGWKLKSVFTNELGKNSVSVGSIGVNSTSDQTVLIFERSKFITDEDAHKMIEKYKDH